MAAALQHVRGVIAVLLVSPACYQPYGSTSTAAVTASNHDSFPIDAGTHGGVDCDACHGAFDTFTRFSCITCHEHAQSIIDPAHAGVSGYTYTETSCYDCHPTGAGMSRAEHTWFPIQSGHHRSVGCTECHPENHESVACFDCHAHTCSAIAPRHDEVRNFSCDSMRCYNCHPSGVAGD